MYNFGNTLFNLQPLITTITVDAAQSSLLDKVICLQVPYLVCQHMWRRSFVVARRGCLLNREAHVNHVFVGELNVLKLTGPALNTPPTD